jgi:hypothetical protein
LVFKVAGPEFLIKHSQKVFKKVIEMISHRVLEEVGVNFSSIDKKYKKTPLYSDNV